MVLDKQPRQQQGLSVLGFLNAEIRPGIAWPVWEQIFYQDLVSDLKKDGYDTNFYDQSGVALLKKDDSKLDALYQYAETRLEESPIIGELSIKMLRISLNSLDLTIISMLLEELEWRGQN